MSLDPEDVERAEIRYVAGLLAREHARVEALPRGGWLRGMMLRIFGVLARTYDLPPASDPPRATLRDAKAEIDARVAELRLTPFAPIDDAEFAVFAQDTSLELDELRELGAVVGQEYDGKPPELPEPARLGGMWICGVVTGALVERMRR